MIHDTFKNGLIFFKYNIKKETRPRPRPRKPTVPTNIVFRKQKIPKIIWQIAVNQCPTEPFSRVINKLKLLNPEYKYYLITDENIDKFILENYGEYIL